MKHQQSGFTLVEIAIVLVIIGLLLGGVLKGQELINSAKAKSYAQDFRTIQSALYGFQDRFKGIPGDLAGASGATGKISGATNSGNGNGQIEGAWDDGGRIGISSTMYITGMTGSYNICSTGVLGKIAKQLDTQLDDGDSTTGSFRVAALVAGAPPAGPVAAVTPVDDATSYTVCLAF